MANLVRIACHLRIVVGMLRPELKPTAHVEVVKAIGPFESEDEADAYIEANPVADEDEWFITTLEAPK